VRTFAGIIVGILAAIAAVLAISWIGDMLFPADADAGLRDPEQVSASFAAAPIGAQLFLVLAWLGGAFAGGVVARRISGQSWPVLLIAGLLLLAALPLIAIVAMPTWLMVALLAAPVIGGFLARHVTERALAPAEPETNDAQI
jgi:uncharacterized protein YneF (UPF0154 family)